MRADDTDATELRYSRNMEEITEEVLDTDFATRLYPLGYGEDVNQLKLLKSVNGGVTYIDSPTQALWDVVGEPYVDTTITDAATLLAQGHAVLELCCNPHVSYSVTCKDISILTGESIDAFYAGRIARIVYRDYGLTIRQGAGGSLSKAHRRRALEREADHRQSKCGCGFRHRPASKVLAHRAALRAGQHDVLFRRYRAERRQGRAQPEICIYRQTWYMSIPSC